MLTGFFFVWVQNASVPSEPPVTQSVPARHTVPQCTEVFASLVANNLVLSVGTGHDQARWLKHLVQQSFPEAPYSFELVLDPLLLVRR